MWWVGEWVVRTSVHDVIRFGRRSEEPRVKGKRRFHGDSSILFGEDKTNRSNLADFWKIDLVDFTQNRLWKINWKYNLFTKQNSFYSQINLNPLFPSLSLCLSERTGARSFVHSTLQNSRCVFNYFIKTECDLISQPAILSVSQWVINTNSSSIYTHSCILITFYFSEWLEWASDWAISLIGFYKWNQSKEAVPL